MWIDPHETGLYSASAPVLWNAARKMLLRVYVDSREDFDRWIEAQRQPRERMPPSLAAGRSSRRLPA
jgi:hypothetical protein